MTETAEEIRGYRILLEQTLTEAPTEQELQRVRQLINGPNGQQYIKLLQQGSNDIATEHIPDLVNLTPQQFGQKYQNISQYHRNYGGAKHDSDRRVADTAANALETGVRKVLSASAAAPSQPSAAQASQPAQAAAQPQQQPAQVVNGQMRGTPVQSPGDTPRQATTPQRRAGGGGDFNAQFAAARKRGETQFTYNGKSYHTRRKNENEPFWRAKMKFIKDENSLNAQDVQTLLANGRGLGPNELKKVQAVAQRVGAGTAGAATQGAAAGNQATAPAGAQTNQAAASAPADRAAQVRSFIQATPDEANRIIDYMVANNLLPESKNYRSRIIKEALTRQQIADILRNPNHPRHAQAVDAFLNAQNRMKGVAQNNNAQQAAPGQSAATDENLFKQEQISEPEIQKLVSLGMTGSSVDLYRKMRATNSPLEIARKLIQGGYRSNNISGDARVRGRILNALIAAKVIDPDTDRAAANAARVVNNLKVYKNWVESGSLAPNEIGKRATTLLGGAQVDTAQFPALAKQAGWSDAQIQQITPHVAGNRQGAYSMF